MSCRCAIDLLKEKPFISLEFQEKAKLIIDGRPKPDLTIEVIRKDRKKIKFQKSWYDSNQWLCGCINSQALYCWPCLLFCPAQSIFSRVEAGLTDVSNFSLMKKRHSFTKEHITSVTKLAKFGRVKIETDARSANKTSVEQDNETVRHNRYVLSRLIDIICLLAKQELPVQGHVEGQASCNRGNYLEFLHFIARTDAVLAEHLKSASVLSGPSLEIQNDLIDAMAEVILDNIKKDIGKANFVSVIFDETTDMSHQSLLSTVLRYRSHNKTQERFIKFENGSTDRRAPVLLGHLLKTLEEFDCKEKLICQTYDGAAVMSGAHNILQKLVREECPSAIFVHCYAHNISLVLQQSCSSIQFCKVFFQICSGLATFFSKSAERSAALEEVVKRKFPTAPTKWFYTHHLIPVLYEVQDDLKTLLDDMKNNIESWDIETRMAASGFHITMEKVEFQFLLKLFSLIFPQAEVLFNVLQNQSCDINLCCNEIKSFKKKILLLKSSMNILDSVVDDTPPPQKRERVNYEIDEKTSYHVLAREIIDNIAVRIQERFENIRDLEFLALVNSYKFESFKTSFPQHSFCFLKRIYGNFFDFGLLKIELQVMYSDPDCYKIPLTDLMEYFTISGLDEALPQVFKLLELCLCIPATNAAVDRSYSYLKQIHTFQRNTPAQERKSHLGLISIEKEYLNSLSSNPLFHRQIIDIFQAKKNGQI